MWWLCFGRGRFKGGVFVVYIDYIHHVGVTVSHAKGTCEHNHGFNRLIYIRDNK